MDDLSMLEHDLGTLMEPASRRLLRLHTERADAAMQRQIDGVVGLAAASVVRPLPLEGPLTFGRGIELTLACDDAAYDGTGPFLLGSVLARFFARYASINAFTETALRTLQRGEVMRWPTTAGRRHTL